MIGLLLTLALQSAPAPPPPAPPPATPATAAEPAVVADDPVVVAANLADLYEKSCGGRIYGTYADACNGLAEQVRKAKAAARKAERARPAGK